MATRHLFRGLATCILCATAASVPPLASAGTYGGQPLFNITASTLYDAGFQVGQVATASIKAWLASEEILALIDYVATGEGRAAYERLRRDSSAAFPQYAEELRGIADGAGVDLHHVWIGNMLVELESLQGTPAEHCSDIFAIDADGYNKGFALGHNEDWSVEARKLAYYVKYTASPGADFESCAGFAYPGALLGWSITWNAHGILMTVNTLHPKRVLPHGVVTAFIQREAMCGYGKGRTLEDVAASLSVPSWSDGASMNVVDLRARRMANIETAKGRHHVLEVTERMGNYSHFNLYKHLSRGTIDVPRASSLARQARADALPPPRSARDVARLLSDSADAELPIFRNTTVATVIVDGSTGNLDAWCCGHSAANGHGPAHSWNVLDFFSDVSALPQPVLV